jgi:nitroreductase
MIKSPYGKCNFLQLPSCHSILISAQSLGYAAQWLTEWYAYDEEILAALGGNIKNDKISGFIYIGGKNLEPKERIRPKKNQIVQYWQKNK